MTESSSCHLELICLKHL